MKYDRLKLAAIFLVLPTLVLGGIIVKNEYAIKNAQTWRVKIQGYDPRDLLMGHYLSFRFDWGGASEDCASGQVCCLCLNKQGEYPSPPTATNTSCEAAKQCVSSITLPKSANSSFSVASSFNTQRYYIPEESAKTLEGYLRDRQRNVTIDVRITKSGWTSLGDLYIDGIKWKDYLNANIVH